MSELNEPCKVNPYVKWHKFDISYSSCFFHLVQCFLRVIFARKNFSVYQCETVRDHQQGRARIFFLILCGKRWRVYEAIFCLWRHCLNRFYSLLKAAIIKLKLTSILINSSYVQSLLWVNRKRKMVNIAWGHIINI